MWRFHVTRQDNAVVKVSEYVYPTEQSALDAASEYVKGRVPRDEVWSAMAAYQSTSTPKS